jgi:tetratricopeptide (TPR) repeat protein
VSLTRLEVPHKAREEYEKACSALKHQKNSDAEQRLLQAVKLYPGYSAAWVLLGQLQELDHKSADSAESCTRAQTIDPNYAPSYLCLAYVIAGQQKWDQLKQVTDKLLQLHPLNASNAYYYNSLASFHLNKLTAAEISARRGIEDNKKHHQPHLHLLLAQIYEKQGDRSAQIAQLHEYLKLDPHGNNVAAVNNLLKQIEPDTAARR